MATKHLTEAEECDPFTSPAIRNAGGDVRHRATATCIALAMCALSLACTRAPELEEPSARPNVLLVSIDSLRSDHVSAYGYERETTPTIDALAGEGVRFDTAMSPTSWTLPAHISLLTAKPPEQHRVIKSKRALRSDAVTLAEALKAEGYDTAGFASGPYLRSVHGYAQGFDVYDTAAVGTDEERTRQDVTSPRVVQRVNDWLTGWSEREPHRPFFVFVHLYDVHFDYVPPPPYDSMFDPEALDAVGGRSAYDHILPGMNDRDLARILALYDGEIRWTDANLARILERLRHLGVFDDTIVVVTSDHGEEFLDHEWRGHGKTLYDEVLRIPLVMRYPRRVPAGQVVEDQVRLVDVAPTILGLAGVAKPPEFGSGGKGPQRERDLSPWITDENAAGPFPDLIAFGELLRSRRMGLVSVRGGDTKYIESVAQPGKNQVFEISQDARELQDLASDAKGRRARELLAAEREAWLDDLSGSGLGFAERIKLDESHVKRLRALGYLE